jgi:hypothetical protein
MPRKTNDQYVTQCIDKGLEIPVDSDENRYVNTHTPILHVCKKGHSPYKQSPNNHIRGQGCPVCAGVKVKTYNQYHQECNSKELDLPSANGKYVNCETKLYHICKKGHPDYEQSPNHHLRGHGCPVCAGNKPKTIEIYHKECVDNNIDLPVIRSDNPYISTHTKSQHICKEGHLYMQEPNSHLHGCGCPVCAGNKLKTDEQYRRECQVKDLDLPEDTDTNRYSNCKTKLVHICKQEHRYPQTPSDHLQGYGCPECAGNKVKIDAEYRNECIIRNIDLPEDNDENRYVNTHTPILHVCKKGHSPYKQSPASHLKGCGCPVCGRITVVLAQSLTDQQYRGECERLNIDPPDNNDTNLYINNRIKLSHTCKYEHPSYQQRPGDHLRGQGCPICGNRSSGLAQRKTHEQYTRECTAFNFDLPEIADDNKYTTATTKLRHVCKVKHVYLQTPNNHLKGVGCPSCMYKTASLLLTFLVSLGFTVVSEQSFEWTYEVESSRRHRRFDFYIQELNLIIELDGPHHFRNVGYSRIEHSHQLAIDTYEKMVPGLRKNFSFMRISQADFLAKYDTMKDVVREALEDHKPTDCVILTVAADLSMYDGHLNMTQLYYDNPLLEPEDDGDDSE